MSKINCATILIINLLVLVLVSAQNDASRHVFSTRTISPPGFSLGATVVGSTPFSFSVFLKQQNLDALESLFWDVSNPKSPKYGEFMSVKDITDLVASHAESVSAVLHWLKQTSNVHRQISIENRGDTLLVKTTVAIAQALLQTQLHSFTHTNGRSIIRAWGAFSMPIELLAHVDLIIGVSDFPMERFHPISVDSSFTDMVVVPQTLRTLYQVPANQRIINTKNSQSAIEFQGEQSFNFADLSSFWTEAGITANNMTADHIIGIFSGGADDESSLDEQYLTYAQAMGVGAVNWYWTEANWLLDWSNNFFAAASVPMVVSISYGWAESAQCDISTECSTLGVNSQQYVARTNTEFQKIGLRGVSIVVASGDSGANSRSNPSCAAATLYPGYPATSAFVTAVGGTQLSNPQPLENPPALCTGVSPVCAAGTSSEEAVSYTVAQYTSGGGFSSFIARPAYQDAAIGAYLNSSVLMPPASYWSRVGRGFPDISANGHNYVVMLNGVPTPVGGTSAATPTISGLVSLLNDIRLNAGKPQLGFLNQLLYQMAAEAPSTFHDITIGDNICTEQGCAASCTGFVCAVGWDAVTGLGTPNFLEMANYVKKL